MKAAAIISVIVSILSALLCVLFIVNAGLSRDDADYAERHYDATLKIDPEGKVRYSVTKGYREIYRGYGCGEYSCQYCNGTEYALSYDEFPYYISLLEIRNGCETYAPVFGIFSLLSLLLFLILQKSMISKRRKAASATET